MLKYFEIMYRKGQGNLQTQQLMSIQAVLDQVFTNNRQPSKALKFSSLRKHPFLLALRRWGRFAKRPQRRRARRNGSFRRLKI